MAEFKPTRILNYPNFLKRSYKFADPQFIEDLKVFKILLYVRQFNFEDISIKTFGSKLTICGKHDEQIDYHGFVKREFKWEYVIPEEFDPESVSPVMSLNGILKVIVYKKKHWENFKMAEDKFRSYIDLQYLKLREFNYKIEGRKILCNGRIKRDDLESKEVKFDDMYYLPIDVIPRTVNARLISCRMLEIEGEYDYEAIEDKNLTVGKNSSGKLRAEDCKIQSF